jgi:hypothetical protein
VGLKAAGHRLAVFSDAFEESKADDYNKETRYYNFESLGAFLVAASFGSVVADSFDASFGNSEAVDIAEIQKA